MDRINAEPVAVSAAVLVLCNAVMMCLVSFGLTLSPDQAAAVMGVANAVVGVVLAVWTRGKVTPGGGS